MRSQLQLKIHHHCRKQNAQLARCKPRGQSAARTPECQQNARARDAGQPKTVAKQCTKARLERQTGRPYGGNKSPSTNRTRNWGPSQPSATNVRAPQHGSGPPDSPSAPKGTAPASLQPRTPRQWLQHLQPYWSASAPPATKPSTPPPQAGPKPVQARPARKAYAIAPGQRSASPPRGYRQKSARASPRLAAREGAGPPSGLPRPQQPASQSPPEGPLMPRPPS